VYSTLSLHSFKLHVHTTKVSCSRKWLYTLEKSYLQSIVQSVAEFHDRNLPETEHVLFLPVSGASFCTRKMAPFTPASFLAQETCGRNLRRKLASLNAALIQNTQSCLVTRSRIFDYSSFSVVLSYLLHHCSIVDDE